MYFTFGLNLYHLLITFSNSLDPNLAQHFVQPKNVLPDQVQTVSYFKGYNKLKLNQCILTLH